MGRKRIGTIPGDLIFGVDVGIDDVQHEYDVERDRDARKNGRVYGRVEKEHEKYENADFREQNKTEYKKFAENEFEKFSHGPPVKKKRSRQKIRRQFVTSY